MGTYKVLRRCWHGGTLLQPGEIFTGEPSVHLSVRLRQIEDPRPAKPPPAQEQKKQDAGQCDNVAPCREPLRRVSVILFDPGAACPHRARAYQRVRAWWQATGFEIIEAAQPADMLEYSKAEIAHAAASEATGDVLIFADGDVVCDWQAVDRALSAVESGSAQWAVPNTDVCRLTEQETAEALSA